MGEYLRQKKRLLPVGLVLFVSIITSVWLFGVKTPAYAVYVDGEKQLVAKSKDQVLSIIADMEKAQEKQSGLDIEIGSKIECKKTFASRSTIIESDKLQASLEKVVKLETLATAIVVDGQNIAFLKDQKTAQQLLKDLKEQYSAVGEGEKILEVSFVEKVSTAEVKVSVQDIMSAQEAKSLVTIGTPNPEKYIVQDGDCLWLIARRNDMYVDDILEANHLDTEKLKPGDELVLVKSKPYISVLAKVEGEKKEKIPYETKVLVDNTAASSIRVKQAGKDGEKHISYIAVKKNGTVAEREIISEKIISNPVTKILVKGTQITQVASRSGGSRGGDLDWPVYGPITKYYKAGHPAIDIATTRGTPIVAADGGYVTFAGWQGNYGYLMIVDHGNGVVTRYAHCDSFVASVGQKVARGETIARLGSTGRSTGPHLHFEVHVYGAAKNPLNHLR